MFIAEFVIVEIRRGKNKNSAQQNSAGHIFTNREAGAWIAFYVTAAIIFGIWLWISYGSEFGQQFLAGWLTEYSLSTDNVFVFAVIMSSFAVPDNLKHRVLEIGILLALILRSGLIFLGAQAIHRFDAAFYVFSIFLFYLAITVWRSEDAEPDPDGNGFVRWVAKRIPVAKGYEGMKPFRHKPDVGWSITPFLLVVIAVGTTDLIFAIDSIPAVFGLTTEAYIVVAVNAFALFGLRQIFFLIDGLLGKVRHLSRGLAAILLFIAFKMLIEAIDATTWLKVPEINIVVSLSVIIGILAATVITSVIAESKRDGLNSASEARSEQQLTQVAGDAQESILDNDRVLDTDQNG
jgi:tellurite resistance protein TerC